MADKSTKLPRWLIEFEEARQSGSPGIILQYNTTDLVYIPGMDIPPTQLKFFIGQHLHKLGYEVMFFSLSQGLRPLSTAQNKQELAGIANLRDPEQILREMPSILKRRDKKFCCIVDYADHLAPTSQGLNAALQPLHLLSLQIFHSCGVDDAVRTTDNLIILISHENQLNELLIKSGSGYRLIQVDLPSQEERKVFAQLLLNLRTQGRGREFGKLSEELSLDLFAQVTGGLRLRDIEEIFRLSAAQNRPISMEMIRERKAISIKQMAQGLLEVIESNYGFEKVAGLDHAKDFFKNLKWRIKKGDTSIPQAILFAGVPGCGKSFLVLAIAKELGFPCLAMRNIREKWVGASERNLDLVLWIAETLAPCILWIDEVDQALGQRTTGESADAGTSERMLARIWEFMGSLKHRGRILWIATTNRPDLLDAATLDRFQVVIPFLHPTPSEVKLLLPILAEQIGRKLENNVDASVLTSIPSLNLPTIRALQEIVVMAGAFADIEAGDVKATIQLRHLERAAKQYKPNYDPILHQFIALTAIRMTSFHFLLPWGDINGAFRKGYELPEYLKEIVKEETMEIDTIALNLKLSELQEKLLIKRWQRQL